MSDKKQSSAEWLEQQFQIIIEKNNIELEKIWQQLKAMHKEEIIKASARGYCAASHGVLYLDEAMDYGKTYYKQTFEQ